METDPENADQAASKQPRRDRKPNPWQFAGAGMELAGASALLAMGGWWLDGKAGTTPLFILLGLFIGVGSGVYRLYRLGKRYF